MKIAICDDNKKDLDILHDYCRQYDKNLRICLFDSAKALLAAYSEELFDIVFLDIEMAPPNGYDIAVQLAQETIPPIIIFTTQTLNYAVRGYGLALKYLPKPISYETFAAVLRLAIDQRTPVKISIETNNKIQVFLVSEIDYIEVIRHQVTMHLKSKPKVTLRCSFAAVLASLPSGTFVQTHKSYCVNLHSVMRMEQNTLTLTDGAQIPIGRNFKAQVKMRLIDFLRGAG